MKKLGIGIMGFDVSYHAEPYMVSLLRGVPKETQDKARLVAIADEKRGLVEHFARKHGVKEWYTDYDKFLKNPDIDVVIVASYNAAHAEHAIAAAEAGKHILVMKMMATTLRDCDRIIDAARRANVKLMQSDTEKFYPCQAKAKELIDEGMIGDFLTAISTFRGSPTYLDPFGTDPSRSYWHLDPTKSGGGGFLDHAAVFFPLDRWWLNRSPVRTVYAEMGNYRFKDIKVEDYGIAIINFENGAKVTLESTWHASNESFIPVLWGSLLGSDVRYPCDIRHFITGSEGDMNVDVHLTPQLSLSGKKVKQSQANPSRSVNTRVYYDWDWDDRYPVIYGTQIMHFAEHILEGKELISTGQDGRAATELVLAAYLSARKKELVRLPSREIE